MDELKKLILIFNKKNCWEDKTSEISFIIFKNREYFIKFLNKNKTYKYNSCYVKDYNNPIEIKSPYLYINNSIQHNVKKILLFGNEVYKIFYKNQSTKFVLASDVKISEKLLNENIQDFKIIEYYKKVVNEICKTKDGEFLISQYNNLNNINKYSVLSLYLNGVVNQKNTEYNSSPLIFPFGLNTSQKDALKNVFSNRMSIIEGPPGTGKTQTILNIISNAIIRKLTVAVVSNNNSATNNIYEKLKEKNYSFICAQLGNVSNINKFFEEYKINNNNPNFLKKEITDFEINNLYKKLIDKFEMENEQKIKMNKLSQLEL